MDATDRVGAPALRDLSDALGETPHVGGALIIGSIPLAMAIAGAGLAEQIDACEDSAEPRMEDGVRIARAEPERLPYEDGTFELVVASGVLSDRVEPVTVLREMRRVTAHGGACVLLAEPTPGGARQVRLVAGFAARALKILRRTPVPPRDDPVYTFDPEEIAVLGEKAGFEDIVVGTASWARTFALSLTSVIGVPTVPARALARFGSEFDRQIADRIFPSAWRHTVKAVLR